MRTILTTIVGFLSLCLAATAQISPAPPNSSIGGAWNSYSPNVNCGTGSTTVNSASSIANGSTVAWQFDITVTTVGTCTTTFDIALPFTAAVGAGAAGQWVNLAGGNVICGIQTGNLTRAFCTVSASLADGARIVVSGVYRR